MAKILNNHHVLAVPNLEASRAFYTEVLGFAVVAEPPGWTFVKKDNCLIMLGECPDDLSPGQLGSHGYFAYWRVDDAAAYHAQLKGKAPEVIGELRDTPWGTREFVVTTVAGHRLMVGQEL